MFLINLSKRMLNIDSKFTKTDVRETSIFDVQKICHQVSFCGAPTHGDIIDLSNFLLQFTNQKSVS